MDAMNAVDPERAGFAVVNRTTLRWWEWGRPEDPPVVCLHGAFDHGRMWDSLAPAVAALGFRVIAVDLRGHGDSGRLSSGHVWFASALDVGLLLRSLGRPAGVVGHSFGGGLAVYAAGVWPELVSWVVDIDGLGNVDEGPDATPLAVQAAGSVRAATRALFQPPRVYADRAEMVERRAAVNTRLPRRWVEHLVEHGSRPVEGGWVWKADPMFNVGLPGSFDLDHLAAEHALAHCPCLLLTGAEHDTWSDLDDAEVARRVANFRDGRHVTIKGAGHYVHLEQPATTMTVVGDFLTEVGGA